MRLRLLVVLAGLLGLAVVAGSATAGGPWGWNSCASNDEIDRGEVIEEFRYIRTQEMSCDEAERALEKAWPWPEGTVIFQRGPWNFWIHNRADRRVRLVDVHITRDGAFGFAEATVGLRLKP